jgi:outer membrane protein insertion porin family
LDVIINAEGTETGRFMIGAGITSDAGVTGQIVIDERNFDWRRFPTSIDDVFSGRAFRGGGQGFRLEAMPGSEVQRYLVNFTQPYLLDSNVSFNLSGYLFDRRYFDWDEQRLGGRVGLGYRLTPDLSLGASLRVENVDIFDPRVPGVPELDAALGTHNLYISRFSLAHDTRDVPFAPSEGHLLELSYEQAFGTFDYPRGNVEYRQYVLVAERADGSGRHVFGYSLRGGFSGAQTPIFENFFAGGYATMRGFEFRGASPKVSGVTVGGEFLMLGSAEYVFPITADDMLKGVMFVDYGTVEEKIEINSENFRVALGLGVRVSVPAMGPAPIAVDFAVPVARADTDEIENISFFLGVAR